MSIIIKGMELPKNCRVCQLAKDFYTCPITYKSYNWGMEGRPSDCPLVEVTDNRWIPVTERLPEEPYGCLVTVWDTAPITMEDFENILPYFVGWDGEQWNDADGEQCPFEVIAWMPLPEPYKAEEGE